MITKEQLATADQAAAAAEAARIPGGPALWNGADPAECAAAADAAAATARELRAQYVRERAALAARELAEEDAAPLIGELGVALESSGSEVRDAMAAVESAVVHLAAVTEAHGQVVADAIVRLVGAGLQMDVPDAPDHLPATGGATQVGARIRGRSWRPVSREAAINAAVGRGYLRAFGDRNITGYRWRGPVAEWSNRRDALGDVREEVTAP